MMLSAIIAYYIRIAYQSLMVPRMAMAGWPHVEYTTAIICHNNDRTFSILHGATVSDVYKQKL